MVQSNKEIEQFAFAASHDLQEPLRSILNFTDLLQKQSPNSENAVAKEAMAYILKASDRMKKLVRDLLEYSRLGDGFKSERIDMNAVIISVIKELEPLIDQHSANITFGVLPEVEGCLPEIKLLFHNLIANAIQYRRTDQAPEIKIVAEGKSKDWVFRISDNGMGIEKRFFEKIFIIFQKLHSKNEYPGTGIGLALCKKIVALHGGKITVESKIGEGSTFSFTLPKAIPV